MGQPSVQKAFAAAAGKSTDGLLDTFSSSQSGGELKYRYITDARTANDGFNAGVIAKNCIVLKGKGYK